MLLLDFVHRRLDLFLWVFTSELGGGGHVEPPEA